MVRGRSAAVKATEKNNAGNRLVIALAEWTAPPASKPTGSLRVSEGLPVVGGLFVADRAEVTWRHRPDLDIHLDDQVDPAAVRQPQASPLNKLRFESSVTGRHGDHFFARSVERK